MRYYYDGEPVRIPGSAEIGNDFRANGRYHKLVQQALDACAAEEAATSEEYDWSSGSIVVFTNHLPGTDVKQYVVSRDENDAIAYGRYKLHMARSPQTVPFVYRQVPTRTEALTVELVKGKFRGDETTMLIRAYGGSFTPPLPWQASAGDYGGGVSGAREFWLEHAFVMHNDIMSPDGLSERTPEWLREPTRR